MVVLTMVFKIIIACYIQENISLSSWKSTISWGFHQSNKVKIRALKSSMVIVEMVTRMLGASMVIAGDKNAWCLPDWGETSSIITFHTPTHFWTHIKSTLNDPAVPFSLHLGFCSNVFLSKVAKMEVKCSLLLSCLMICSPSKCYSRQVIPMWSA